MLAGKLKRLVESGGGRRGFDVSSRSETSQGCVIPFLRVCDDGGGGQTIPVGSIFRNHLIGPQDQPALRPEAWQSGGGNRTLITSLEVRQDASEDSGLVQKSQVRGHFARRESDGCGSLRAAPEGKRREGHGPPPPPELRQPTRVLTLPVSDGQGGVRPHKYVELRRGSGQTLSQSGGWGHPRNRPTTTGLPGRRTPKGRSRGGTEGSGFGGIRTHRVRSRRHGSSLRLHDVSREDGHSSWAESCWSCS